MKYALHLAALVCTVGFAKPGYSQINDSVATVPQEHVVQRKADSCVTEVVRTIQDAAGRTVTVTNSFTTLATGMNVEQPDGSFTPADSVIELQPDGTGAGQKTRHKLYLQPDITDPNGLVRIVGPAPENLQFVARPLCISYWDSKTGQSVLIGEFKSTIGTLAPGDSKVVYADCCVDFKCNLIIQNSLSGVESWLELVEAPPPPSDFGLNNDSTRLELITEFLASPQPQKSTVINNGVSDDLTLSWCEKLKTPSGVAFKMGDKTSTHVHKQWTTMDNRQCLIESVDYGKAQAALNLLPAVNHASLAPSKRIKHVAAFKRELPKRVAAIARPNASLQIAKLTALNTGYLIDYSVVASGGPTTFAGGTTYFVTNAVNLTGMTVLEGGAIIKYSTNAAAKISIESLDCRTGSYAPAIFTSMMDDSVGDSIPGSTGDPSTNYCGDVALESSTPENCPIHDLRFGHLNAGFRIPYSKADGGGGSITGSNLQFVHCKSAFVTSDSTFTLHNSLFVDIGTLFDLPPDGDIAGQTFTGINLTIHNCANFAVDYTGGGINFTNCLLVQVATNFRTIFPSEMRTNAVVQLTNDAGVFQSVGAGDHYLGDGSLCRGTGTTNGISPDILSALQKKTTYPPLVQTNTEFSDITLSPAVLRDTVGLDIGYHYDPIDYIVQNYTISNAVVTITNGAVIGYYHNNGLWVADGSQIYSQGTPLNPNRFVSYLTVQEGSTNIGLASDSGLAIKSSRNSGVGQPGVFRFTQFNRIYRGSTGTNVNCDFFVNSNSLFSTLEIKDCAFSGGGTICLASPSGITVGMTNNLFEAETLAFTTPVTGSYALTFQNNLLHEANYVATAPLSSWLLHDNILDSSAVNESSGSSTHDHNAYINTSTNNFPTNAGDIVLTSFTYDVGPLGSYYQPTNSLTLYAGSQFAANAGLFHYTVLTNELKEATNQVSIGLHYVAIDANGNPSDTDSDGVQDFLEDANGNGTVDSGETDWQNASDLGLKVQITRPQNTSKLP